MLKLWRLEERWQLRLRHRKLSSQTDQGQITAKNDYTWRKPMGEQTGINVYNHNVRGKVPLVLRNAHLVTWYTCGPTVYDSTHIGHASTYVKLDIIQRILREYFKYNLVSAMNITDVDDKIIKRSRETGRNWQELASGYDAEFKLDMQRLNVKAPNLRAHVSANIPNIQKFIEQLLINQQAYVTQDKSVYFDVSSCDNYGKLQKVNLDDSEEPDGFKRNTADFALWKAKKVKGEPSWVPSWGGAGRPGWHIECSAIASMFFGGKVDIHAGGLDLRFPHHENEEAQCCAYYKTDQWVNYWLHTGQLHVVGDERKMSKSLGNTITVTELLQNYSADEFRMACLLSKYRNAMAYSDQVMLTARQTLQKFQNFHADLSAYMQMQKPLKYLDEGALRAQLKHTVTEFDNSLRDDFDTARAISILIDQMSSISRCINEQQADAKEEPAHCLDVLLAAGNFIGMAMQNFGLSPLAVTSTQQQVQPVESTSSVDINAMVAGVLDIRETLRKHAFSSSTKNVELLNICDNMRDLLQRHGFRVRDHKHGTSWTYSDARSASRSG